MANSTDALVEYALGRTDPAAEAPIIRSLVDTVGVTLAGFDSDVIEALDRWGQTELAPGDAVVWGRAQTASPSRAALINGTAAHALDFDDAAPSMPMHPSAVVWPAVLAWTDVHETDTDAVLRAADIGQTVFRAIGEALPMKVHYARGWHSTATVGRLAATASLIHLAGLTTDQARSAVGIAATMAAGAVANFGTMTKPMHAGQAAQDAVVAVGMAKAGLTANPSQLDHPKGYFSLFGVAEHPRADLADRLRFWQDDWAQEWTLKRYPACYGTHRAVDAIIELHDEIGSSAAEFDQIEVRVHPSALEPLISHLPSTGLEGKFSMPYTMVRALTEGRLDLDAFTDERVNGDGVLAMMERVNVVTADAPSTRPDLAGAHFAEVAVTLPSGSRFERLVEISRGDARNPLTDAEVDAKFLACCAVAGWGSDEAGELLVRMRALPSGGTLASLRRSLQRRG